MNINKKLDRVKQWAGEKMGAEAKTSVSEEFHALEMEMALRHDGMSPKFPRKIPLMETAVLIKFMQVWRKCKSP